MTVPQGPQDPNNPGGYPGQYAGGPGDYAGGPGAGSAYPGQPSYPGQPGQPSYPGQPGQAQYPGQPGQAQYPGQPTYPGQPGFPPQPQPGQPYPGAPAGVVLNPGDPTGQQPGGKTKKSVLPRVLIAVLVVLIAGGATWFFTRDNASHAAVGDCMKVNSVSADNADLSIVNCNDAKAAFKVTAASKSEITCDDGEASYTETSSKKSNDVSTKLCLQPNVTAGDCWEEPDSDTQAPSKVSCDATKGQKDVVKVLAFDHSTSDPKACPADTENYLDFPTHTGVLCVEPNN